MKIFLLLMHVMLFSTIAHSQNVGISVPSPTEKLDVNGNINLTGTIKTSGAAGQTGQALMTNSTGNMVWGDLTEYKNFVTFTVGTSSTWTVPAGVTKIYVVACGGGGGGTGTGGGGGGGYVTGLITVTPASGVTYTVGAGGAAGSPTATDGGGSFIFYPGTNLSALGGSGSTYTTFGSAAPGGSFSGPNGGAFTGQAGEAGGSNNFGYHQPTSTSFLESQTGGMGGDAGNTKNTGGKGTYQLRNPISLATIYVLYGSSGKIPGGGGGGNVTWGGIIQSGAQGLVTIHY